MNLEDITPGLSIERQREIAAHILKVMQPEQQREAPLPTQPEPPDFTRMDEHQKTVALTEYRKARDAYERYDAHLQALMDAPAGTPMSTEDRAMLAAEALAALRRDGMRL
jgi:hypothetical protein